MTFIWPKPAALKARAGQTDRHTDKRDGTYYQAAFAGGEKL